MRNKYLVIILTCITFLAVCAVCFKVLFTVRDITVEYSVVSDDKMEEVSSILEKYKGKSIFSVNTDKIREEITESRYLKVLDVKKIFPCEISVSLAERREAFYYRDKKDNSEVYYLFDNEFFVVGASDVEPLYTSGLIGVGFVDKLNDKKPSFELKKVVNFDYGFNNKLIECVSALGDDSNVKSIIFVSMPEQGNFRLILRTTEGVSLEIIDAAAHVYEKTAAGLHFYGKLSESERIANYILVRETNEGIECTYTKNSAIPADWGVYRG